MPDIHRLAAEARTLLSNDAFQAVMGEIRTDATSVFLNPASTMEAIEAAHRKVQAIETVENALNARITAQTFADKKKDQHRVND